MDLELTPQVERTELTSSAAQCVARRRALWHSSDLRVLGQPQQGCQGGGTVMGHNGA